MPSKIPTPNLNRNPEIAPKLRRFGSHAQYVRKGVWAIKNRKTTAAKTTTKQTKEKPFGKKGEKRTIRATLPVWFPADRVHRKLHTKNTSNSTRTPKLRANITPGTILILLAGRFRGRRVVFLKQLPSGLLLVTGPQAINGVPLRRVNQRYVIATSTKVDVSGVKLDAKVNDDMFKRPVKTRTNKSEKKFFGSTEEDKKKKPQASPEKKALQKSVDESIVAAIKKVDNLSAYMASHFIS
jgi:large subunit ribosomal protein L6e